MQQANWFGALCRSFRSPLRLFGFGILFAIFACKSAFATPQSIIARTSVFAPLQINGEDKPSGYAIEIMQIVFERLKEKYPEIETDIEFYPFKRMLTFAKNHKNTLIFSIARTEAREKQFRWLHKISPYEVYLYKLKSNTIPKLPDLETIRQSDIRLGMPYSGHSLAHIKTLGFQEIVDFITYDHYTKGIRMLFRGRFDMLPLTSFVARTNICRLGLDGDAVEQYMRLDDLSAPLWLASHKDFDPALADTIVTIMQSLQADGTIESITERYITKWQTRPCVAEE